MTPLTPLAQTRGARTGTGRLMATALVLVGLLAGAGARLLFEDLLLSLIAALLVVLVVVSAVRAIGLQPG